MQEPYRPIDGPIEDRKRRLKDVDAVERAHTMIAVGRLAPPLLLLSFLVVVVSGSLLAGLAMGLGGALFYYIIVLKGAIGGTAWLFGRLFGVGSTGTPLPNTFWRAQALSVRGAHADALADLELEALDDPDDPGPCLRAASVCADELHDPEKAIDWYQRAQRTARIEPETHAYVSTRVIELYRTLGQDGRAVVELGRLLALHPDSKYADGARTHLAELKARLWESGT